LNYWPIIKTDIKQQDGRSPKNFDLA